MKMTVTSPENVPIHLNNLYEIVSGSDHLIKDHVFSCVSLNLIDLRRNYSKMQFTGMLKNIGTETSATTV